MTNPSTLERYNQLTKDELTDVKAGLHLVEEDARLDEMDVLWEQMTEEDRTKARKRAVELLEELNP